MASNAKKKTTFAKMNREAAVREKRLRKAAKKEARKQEALTGPVVDENVDAPAEDEATP